MVKNYLLPLFMIGITISVSFLPLLPFIDGFEFNDYLEGNNIAGNNKLVFLDYDFEKDILWDFPYIGMINTNQPNLNFTVAQEAAHGQLLYVNKSGDLAGWARATIAFGQPFRGGSYYFEFDFFNEQIDSEVHGFQINAGAYSNTLVEHLLQIVDYNSTHDRAVWDYTDYYIPNNNWTNFIINYDWDNSKARFYMNDILCREIPLNVNNLAYINIAIPDYLSDIISGYFDNIQLYAYAGDVYTPKTPDGEIYVSIMFDDANIHDLTIAKPIMGDMPGCCNIITSYIGNDGRLTWDNVQYLHDAGWDIWSHSHLHTSMTNASYYPETTWIEINKSKQAIIENTTFEPTGFVYPYNAHNDTIDMMVWTQYEYTATYYDGVSRIDNDISNFTFGLNDFPRYGVFRIARFLPTILYGSNQYIISYFHAIVDDDNLVYGCNQSAFEWYIDILDDNDINVVRPSDILYYVRNAQNCNIDGTVNDFEITLPTTYGNYTAHRNLIISAYVDETKGRWQIVDASGRHYSYTKNNNVITFVGPAGHYMIEEVLIEKEYYSYIWLIIFLLPGILLGLYAGKMGMFGGLIMMTILFGFTQTNGELLLFVGAFSLLAMGLNLKGGDNRE